MDAKNSAFRIKYGDTWRELMRTAFITGVTGQDGSYLAEYLLKRDYVVHGLIRRSSASNYGRIAHLMQNVSLKERFFLHYGDLCDGSNIRALFSKIMPEEIYNLAAMSHVKTSFEMPEYTADVDGIGVLKLLEAMREIVPKARFYQASTSELYGKVQEIPQTEKTPFYPRSPYGVAKLFAYWTVVNYREAYDLFACNGILFNHESPRRGDNFVSKKITRAVACIKHGLQKTLVLGNLDAQRDWGFAKDFVEGIWLVLQQNKPEDFVLATGKTFSVRHFVELAFREVGVHVVWQGKGIEEKGLDAETKKILIEISPEFFRPTEVDILVGDASKAEQVLGWKPRTNLEDLVQLMVAADLEEVAHERRVFNSEEYLSLR